MSKCQQFKNSGLQCNYKSKFTREDGKQVCGIHNKKIINEEKEEEIKIENIKTNKQN